MKKGILSLSAIAVACLTTISFTSCKDKDGVYKPKEKISKIYYEQIRLYPATGEKDTTQKKELVEVWKWNKNKLSHIEKKGSGWAMDFIYDGKQLTKIESGGTVFNFFYKDKSLLDKIEVLDEDGKVDLNIIVSARNDDKITKLTYEKFTYDNTKSLKDNDLLFDKLQSVMNIMIGNNFGEDMHKNMGNDAKRLKATTTTTTVVDLTYEGNNVTKTILTTENSTTAAISVYTYDSKVNPFYRALNLLMDIGKSSIPTSENNVLSYYNQADPKNISTYEYSYDSKNFPTQRVKIYEGESYMGTKYTDYMTDYYEYEE